MGQNKEALNGVEQDSIIKAVMGLIREFPLLQEMDVGFETLEKDEQCLGVYGMQGAIVIKRYINGAFVGMVPLGIIYRSNPKTDNQKIDKIEFLNKLAKWLNREKVTGSDGVSYQLSEYPAISEQRVIQEIQQNDVPFKDNSSLAGDNDYAVTLKVVYKKRK